MEITSRSFRVLSDLKCLLLAVIGMSLIFLFYTRAIHNQKVDYDKYKRPVSFTLLDPINDFTSETIEIGKACYQHSNDTENIELLEDILEASLRPKENESIFFIETSCSKNKTATLTARQACAIESAARLNMDRDIFILFVAPVGFPSNQSAIPSVVAALTSYENIHFRNLNLNTYVIETPVEDWLATNELYLSKHLNDHTSEFVRLLTLYRYGGTCLNWDIIVQRKFDELRSNSADAAGKNIAGADIFNIQHDNIGNQIINLCIREFYETFDGSESPADNTVLGQVLQTVCALKSTNDDFQELCTDFKILKTDLFHETTIESWFDFFDPNLTNVTLDAIRDKFFIHLQNENISDMENLKPGAKVAYQVIIEEKCPEVLSANGGYF